MSNYLNDEELATICLSFFKRFSALDVCIFVKKTDPALYEPKFSEWAKNSILTDNSLMFNHFVNKGITAKDDIASIIVYELHTFLRDKIFR